MDTETSQGPTASSPNELPRAELIQAIVRETTGALPDEQAALSEFLPSYYGSVPLSDLNRYSIADLSRAAAQHWQL